MTMSRFNKLLIVGSIPMLFAVVLCFSYVLA